MIRPEPGDDARPTSSTGEPSPWDMYGVDTPGGGTPRTVPIDEGTVVMPVADPYADQYDRAGRRVVEPVVPVAPVAPVAAARVYSAVPQAVVTPVQPEPVYYTAPPEDRSPWWMIAAVLALVVGGVVGFLIGRSTGDSEATISTTDTVGTIDPSTATASDQRVNDIFTLLAAQAKQPAGIQTPTPYPALDELLATLSAGNTTTPETATPGSASSDDLTAERDQLAAQVADLQNQLTESQAALAAAQATASTGGASSDQQAQLDEQADQITRLQQQLDNTNKDLDTVQTQLAAANKTVTDLDPKPLGNLVGSDIAKVRTTAKANGWTLVEQPTENATAAIDTVTAQTPAANTTMIKGSVLYVEVAAEPDTTG